jgi:hypothetical protein
MLDKTIVTKVLAAQIGVTDAAIRRRLADTGSYYGLVPDKLPNGRLLWPDDALDQLRKPRVRSAETV